MPDPKTSIARGIDARERAGTTTSIPLHSLAGAPGNLNSLRQSAARATSKLKRTLALTEAINADVARFTESKRLELSTVGKSTMDTGSIIDRIGQPARQVMLDEAVSARRRMARNTSEDERYKIRRELKDALAAANLVRDLYTDPIRVIHDRTITSNKRATMAVNLQASGPMAVADAMRSAVIRKDFELASAVLSAYDKLTKTERDLIPIGRLDFADAIAGLDARKARAAYLALEVAHDEAEIVNREVEGRGVGQSKIGLAMKRRELETLAAELPEENVDGLPGFKTTTPDPKPTETPEEKKARLEKEMNDRTRQALIDSGHGSALEALGYGPNVEDGGGQGDA